MGTWGYGPLDNDSAADVEILWNERLSTFPKEACSDGFLKLFLDRGLGETIEWNDFDTISRIIAIAELARRNAVAISGLSKRYFEEAISIELKPSNLKQWEHPKPRKAALLELLKDIEGKRIPESRLRLFHDPELEFKNVKELEDLILNRIEAFHDEKHMSSIDSQYPKFWHILNRVMNAGLWEVSTSRYDDIIAERKSLLILYISAMLGFDRKEAEELLESAKKKKSKKYSFGWSNQGWLDTWDKHTNANKPLHSTEEAAPPQ